MAEYHDFRARTIGVRPLFNFIELAYRIALPDHVWGHPFLTELETRVIQLISIHNDCLSYFKEQRDAKKAGRGKHLYNVLAVMKDVNGTDTQHGMERAADMAQDFQDRIVVLLNGLYALGSSLDTADRRQLDLYVEGILNCVRANLWWSYRTKWYFGDRNDQVKAAGVVVEKEHE